MSNPDLKKKISISVFFPCYNDAGTIGSMVVLAFQALDKICDDYEVLVVDDGSVDHSRNVLLELKKKYERLKLIFHEKNLGYGGALRSGFKNATKDYIFYTDGDAQYNPLELEKLVSALNGEVDIVNGYKKQRNDPIYRIIIGKIYNYVMKLLFAIKISDIDCDFRLIKRSVFDSIELKYNSGVICVEMIKKMQDAGFRFIEIGISHYFRSYGRSQFFNFRRIFEVGKNILRLWWDIVFCKNFLNKISNNITLSNVLRRIVENDFKSIKQIIRKELIIKREDNILDMGCGAGMFSQLFGYNSYMGIDISQKYIAYAKKRYKRNFEVMDAVNLRFSNSSLNNILIFGVLHHLPDEKIKRVLGEVKRVLNSDGKVLVIEDIPTISYFNIFGKIMHYFDRGQHIRSLQKYRNLFSEDFFVTKAYPAKSGICDYGVFILRKDKNG